MGVVNLFADMTYEGGASINGQFLGSLGANAAAVSIIAGAGECLGYALRSVAEYLADKTGKYWPITFGGYAVNLLAVPAMALAPGWQAAGALVLADRIGRAFSEADRGSDAVVRRESKAEGDVYGFTPGRILWREVVESIARRGV